MKYTLIMAVIAVSSMAINAYFLKNAHNAALALDVCAREQNVYACKFEAVPQVAPRVVYKQAALLPPPAL